MSKVDEDGEASFSVVSDGEVVVRVLGHVVCAIPITKKAALSILDSGSDRTFYDPTTGEEFLVTGIMSRAGQLAKHDAESGRGAVRVRAGKGKTDWTLDEVQAEILGTAKRGLTEQQIRELAANPDADARAAAIIAMFRMAGAKITE